MTRFKQRIATLEFLFPFHILPGAIHRRTFLFLDLNSPKGCSSLNGLLMVTIDNVGRLSTNDNEGYRLIDL